ncbi:hypothetical protein [Sphingomonas sp. M1-B02]|uniref:hypothetical protein n=1 Tax=Sphingomonas sp. M1-B02 TaxID=3114300 RepID=UPI00223E9BDF|nr:hypothetical protein [Sphingomonas sp. S6-11]UZK65616.1 hypothetical protein OKW87_14015 [Sphingomonas sp. S6-11]
MIRICLAAAAALLLAGCSNAPEDLTARYSLGGGAGTLTVKAAANGDARIDSGEQVLVTRGGAEYLVLRDSQGPFTARVGDFIAVMGEMMREGGMKPIGLGAQPEYALTKGGTETVAGISGDLWKAQPKGATSPDEVEAVISSDPAYANIGKALAMQTRMGAASMEQVQGGQGNLEKSVAEMLGKGTVLRFGDALKLEKIERTPLSAADLALPEPTLDKVALKTRMVAERERAKAARGAIPAPTPAPGQPQAK